MHLKLEIKRYHEFFWLRSIRAVNIYKCCVECFIGQKDNRVYYRTLYKPAALIDIEVKHDPHCFCVKKQRTCRNWIFANYINDGMLRGGNNHGNE